MSMTECYQALEPWLCTPFDRAHRAYLETHLELLASPVYQFLELFTGENKDDSQYEQHLRTCLQLLHDARIRGGTLEAVREAYINVFGGLLLDPPVWLLEKEHLARDLSRFNCSGRMVASGKMQLKDVIEQAERDERVAPEIVAELQYRLGNLFALESHEGSLYGSETAIVYYEAALQVYQPERYPLQCAKTLSALGVVYGRKTKTERFERQADNLSKALHCYEAALRVWEPGGDDNGQAEDAR